MTGVDIRFLLTAIVGLLLVWGGSAPSMTPVAASARPIHQIGESAAKNTATDCATLATPHDRIGDQRAPGNNHDPSPEGPDDGCCMTACSVLAHGPDRFAVSSVAWTRVRVALVVNGPQNGRLISPPRRPPKARA
ncbi:hypothetical protein GCM10007856_00800 [Azospirillum oryzae]|nr:hypothetical protein GCM10007856_00800 [Azospirillum oryzae]